jgi:hypothetical protein
MVDTILTWSFLSLIGLGVFHGLNPGMGWLFAVALGFQERRASAVVAALGPIALGHALSIAVVALAVGLLGTFLPTGFLLTASGVALLVFAAYKVVTRFRHPRWVRMRITKRELIFWSFLMASAHGAGLMLIPIILGLRSDGVASAVAEGAHAHHTHHAADASEPIGTAIVAVAVHTGAMLATSIVLALVVYSVVGVGILRKAWINLDWIWAGALVVTGGATLVMGLGELIGVQA